MSDQLGLGLGDIPPGPKLDVRIEVAPRRPIGEMIVGFQIEVLGTPAPKGSARAFYKAGMKRAVIVKDNSERQRAWDGLVREAAQAAIGPCYAPPFVDRALAVRIVFRMVRPAGHWGKGKRAGQLVPSAPQHPRTKPDIDKLARATLDALIGCVFDDDARIALLILEKVYAAPGKEGATIWVEEMPSS